MHLKKLRRKIVEIQLNIKKLYCNNKLIQILLVFLLLKYIATRDTFNTQNSFDVEIILQKLQKKEYCLRLIKLLYKSNAK